MGTIVAAASELPCQGRPDGRLSAARRWLAVDGDPLADIACLAGGKEGKGQGEHIALVMQQGRVAFSQLAD